MENLGSYLYEKCSNTYVIIFNCEFFEKKIRYTACTKIEIRPSSWHFQMKTPIFYCIYGFYVNFWVFFMYSISYT